MAMRAEAASCAVRASVQPAPGGPRPSVRGKFLWAGDEKLYVRGVTYGTFAHRDGRDDYPADDVLEHDLTAMSAAGFNALRTYTPPPIRLLDAAARHGLRVMVGLPWEQHVAFLDERRRAADIERRVREGVASCAGHPAVLCYAVGNEIPAPIVRWHGRHRVERFLARLTRGVRAEDPGGLVTYVNFPTTEYLELGFLDLCCFNVYLEDEARLEAYLHRLQVVAGSRPLVMAEIGLDSRRNGEEEQAEALRWQLRTAFRAGCAGAMVFAWTDEWHRGGHDIEDWDFGLTRRDRTAKPALSVVSETLGELPRPDGTPPRMSVVVCSYNGARTIGTTLAATRELDYPDYEVIVVDDGSSDDTAAIAAANGARVISTPNRGLSSARNTGARAATGDIVAYLDDDAWPDPHWLTYLATTFAATDHVAVGGPNLPPRDAGVVAECVANAPGGPVEVLLSDSVAEHVPGCNLAIRWDALLAIGGFDEQFHVAGDDVDLCWRLQDQGRTIGWSPAAMVWHQRRDSVRRYWRQQRAYGRAEAMLERKWPERYNGVGHVCWSGRIYLPVGQPLMQRWRVYYGTWGSAFFQRLYAAEHPHAATYALMPEWLCVIGALALLTGLGSLWAPLLWGAPVLMVATAAFLAVAVRGALLADFPSDPPTRRARAGRRLLTAVLFVLQPVARLWGRWTEGLVPWRRRPAPRGGLARPRTHRLWCEEWRAPEDRLTDLEAGLRDEGLTVRRGGDFDRWDLDVRGGALGSARARLATEEHGSGRQLLRVRLRPRLQRVALPLATVLAFIAVLASAEGVLPLAAPFAIAAITVVAVAFLEGAAATARLARHLPRLAAPAPEAPPPAAGRVPAPLEEGGVAAVLIDGAPPRETLAALLDALVRRDVALHVAVVSPSPLLARASLEANLRAARPGASTEDIRAAVAACGATELVEGLPGGYATSLTPDGRELPGDLLRRLPYIRAFLADPDVVVLLDVGDGHGDALAGLPEIVRRLAEGRSVVVTTSDPATAARADSILGIVDGAVAAVDLRDAPNDSPSDAFPRWQRAAAVAARDAQSDP